MTKKTIKRIRLIYGIVLSVLIIVVALSLMACSAHIYLTGDHTYTAEKVAAYFSLIAVPTYVCFVLILGGFLLQFLLPEESKKKAFTTPVHMLLARSKRKTLAAGPVLTADIQAEEKRRSKLRSLTISVLTVAFISFLLYSLNPSNFTEDINSSVIRGFAVMALCLVAPFGIALVTVYRNNASMRIEAELRKQAQMDPPVPPAQSCKNLPSQIARFSILLVAVSLVVIGLMGNGTKDVLTKAINICTECIGLG